MLRKKYDDGRLFRQLNHTLCYFNAKNNRFYNPRLQYPRIQYRAILDTHLSKFFTWDVMLICVRGLDNVTLIFIMQTYSIMIRSRNNQLRVLILWACARVWMLRSDWCFSSWDIWNWLSLSARMSVLLYNPSLRLYMRVTALLSALTYYPSSATICVDARACM